MTFVPANPAKAHASPSGEASWFAVGKRGLLARRDESTGQERWVLPGEDDIRALGLSRDDAYLFGTVDGAPAFAVSVPDGAALAPGFSMLSLRALVDAFDEGTFAIAGQASHVLDWATTSRFCGRCGSETARVPDEWCMRCPTCAHMLYPRIAPAVIVLVRRGDEALLARNARFPLPFYSTLAGFSGIGETLEETVRRELLEEVGVRVGSLRYFGSQPWPFPN